MPLSTLILLFVPVLFKMRNDLLWRLCVVIGTILIIMANYTMYFSSPKSLDKVTTFNSVFYGILKNSPDVQNDLVELHLGQELSVLAGRNSYEGNLPIKYNEDALEKSFFDKVNKADIMWFYVKHPLRFTWEMEYTANCAFDNNYYNGSFEKTAGNKPMQNNNIFTTYNSIRKTVFPRTLLFIASFYLIYAFLIITKYIKEKKAVVRFKLCLVLLLIFIGLIQFVLPIVGNGEADVTKQLFMFNVTFDLLLLIAVFSFFKWLSNCGMRGRH